MDADRIREIARSVANHAEFLPELFQDEAGMDLLERLQAAASSDYWPEAMAFFEGLEAVRDEIRERDPSVNVSFGQLAKIVLKRMGIAA